METPLFPARLIDRSVSSEIPYGFVLRPLQRGDYDKGVLTCLSHLTVVGDISKERFMKQYDYFVAHSHEYFIVVVEDVAKRRIAGCGTMMLERKFIHNLGMCGHLEDVVTSPDYRGMYLGQHIILALTSVSRNMGAYKTILDCNEKNASFYAAKCGFTRKEYQMVVYHEKEKIPGSNLKPKL